MNIYTSASESRKGNATAWIAPACRPHDNKSEPRTPRSDGWIRPPGKDCNGNNNERARSLRRSGAAAPASHMKELEKCGMGRCILRAGAIKISFKLM